MPIYIGNTKLTNLKIGSTTIDKVFVGNTQVYPDMLTGAYMYNVYAIRNPNFCPSGWRIPTYNDVQNVLLSYLGGYDIAGGKLKQVGTSNWNSPNTGATNESGFTLLGTGVRYSTGEFSSKGVLGQFVYIYDADIAFGGWADYNSTIFYQAVVGNNYEANPVRLIKTDSNNPGTVTDYDGNVYNCITIGTQVWTQSDFKCTHLNNGTSIPLVQSTDAYINATSAGYCIYPD